MNRNSTSLVLASAPCCLVSDILWPQLCEAWCLKEAWAGCKELDSDGQGKWAQAKQCQNPTQLDQPVICYLASMLAPLMAPRVLPSDIPRVPGGNDETNRLSSSLEFQNFKSTFRAKLFMLINFLCCMNN